jgi:acyl carrier protein
VNTVGDFVGLVRDELGLPITVDDLERDLHELPGWDSMHLLWLLVRLERRTGRSLQLADLLEAPNLEQIYALVATD